MIVRHLTISASDARGCIVDVVQDTPFEHAALIRSKPGAVRGNHYHRASTQYVLVLSGRLRVTTRMPGCEAKTVDVGEGDLVINEPLERHAMTALENTAFLVLTHGPRGGDHYESDTFREDA